MEKNFGLNELQSLRLEILKANGYDIRQAKAVVDFVVGEKAHDIPAQHILEDGVYIITKDGAVIPFIDEMQPAPHDVEYVGIVQGKRSLAVALTDVKGYAVTLTNNLDQTGESRYYIDRYEESVRNYDGEANTQHLREIGLNPQIELKDGEYIPSLGELYILCLNQYVINKALKFVGGQPIVQDWYWSSTEHSAAYAWYSNLSNGGVYGDTKATGKGRVRAVSKFPTNI